MWKFVDEICPRCAIDLATVKPERIRWRWFHPYSRCPNCGDVCPVIEVEPEPKVKGRKGAPEPEAPAEAPNEKPEAGPESPPGEAPAEEPGPEE